MNITDHENVIKDCSVDNACNEEETNSKTSTE